MKAIGGYFGLELQEKQEYHLEAIRLNTGRNALEYILLVNKYKKLYLPFYSCDVLLEPLKRNNIEHEFYKIDENFEPLFDYKKILENEAFLYINYFGLKENYAKEIASHCKNLIIDSSQSFFSMPISEIDTFYSPRKFLGVPDGGYAYSKLKLESELQKDISFERCEHLLKRVDISAEEGYVSFVTNDHNLNNEPVKTMSDLTKSLLASFDYKAIATQRKKNFNYLHQLLKDKNKLKLENAEENVPMVYPFWQEDGTLKSRLLQHKIYTATYWPNVFEWCEEEDLEYKMAKEIVYLPIDQRYSENDLDRIFQVIKNQI